MQTGGPPRGWLLPVRIWNSIHTLFWVWLVFFLLRGDSEERIYTRLVESAITPTMSREQVASTLNTKVHSLLKQRSQIWGKPLGGLYETLFSSFGRELTAPRGSCGSFAAVLAKTLHSAGMPYRYAQMMTTDGIYGGHILIEAEVEPKRWVALDPYYGLSFKRPDGRLASFDDLHKSFDHYRSQLPAEYGKEYEFKDVRYTNWDKIPILMPLMHWGLSLFMSSESLKTLCLRSYLNNQSYADAIGLAVIYVSLLIGRSVYRRWPGRPGHGAAPSGSFTATCEPSQSPVDLDRRSAALGRSLNPAYTFG